MNSLVGRLGARLAKTWELNRGAADPWLITGWLRASYAYEFLGEPVTTVGTKSFDADYSGSSVILNAGLDAHLSANTALYGSVDYEYQFDDIGQSIGGQIGLKVRW